MFRGRGLIALIVGILVIGGIPAFVIAKLVNDDVDKKLEDNGLQRNATDISADQSLYRSENFAKALAAVKKKEGGSPELLKVQVLGYQADFEIKKGERAHGWRYFAKSGDLVDVKVTVVGSGTLEGQQFAFSKVSSDALGKIVAASKEHGVDKTTSMTLEKGLTGGALKWSLVGEGGGRTGLVFNAKPDGSGFAEPTEFAQKESGSGSGSGSGSTSVGNAEKLADCLKNAGTDVAKITACSK